MVQAKIRDEARRGDGSRLEREAGREPEHE
jgi:hypothetical protein